MTEAEWNACTETRPLLTAAWNRLSDRKAKLIACAIARRLGGDLLDPRSLSAIEAAEDFVEGAGTWAEFARIVGEAGPAWEESQPDLGDWRSDRLGAMVAAGLAVWLRAASLPTLLSVWWGRDAALPPDSLRASALVTASADIVRDLIEYPGRRSVCDPAWLGWRDCTLWAMAEAVAEKRRYADMPILADALEEAGCAERALLDHLRGPGPHFPGCWALDCLLDREPREREGWLVLVGRRPPRFWKLAEARSTSARIRQILGPRARFAEARFRVEPLHGSEAIVFRNAVDPAVLREVDAPSLAEYLSGVVTGIRAAFNPPECASFGGVAILLTDLRAHPVDSSHAAFQQAAEQALAIEVVGQWPWINAWD